jgi:cystathionine gamma-synthase
MYESTRFFIHKIIQKLASAILQQYGRPGEDCMLFPSQGIASRCLQFIKNHSTSVQHPAVRILEFVAPPPNHSHISYEVSAVIFPVGELKVAKQFWQHTGEGISSRRAQFFHHELDDGFLLEKGVAVVVDKGPAKGPKRYNKLSQDKVLCRSKLSTTDITGTFQFVEERFGRNLDLSFVDNAKLAIRRRITGTLRANVDTEDAIESYPESSRDVEGFTENDVFLYPSGMSAIYNAHRLLMEILGAHKSICYGFVSHPFFFKKKKIPPTCFGLHY